MDDAVVGIRFAPRGPLVFCYTGDHTLTRDQRVRVAIAGEVEVREGVVAIAPAQIIAAPVLADAPRVAGLAPVETPDDAGAAETPGVVFLPADGGGVGPADLAHALERAALPVPAPPVERR
jgi:hypothetical protein